MADFKKAQYINLETYRMDGTPVLTPVWFAEDENGEFLVYSEAEAGKVKRLRKNPKTRVAPCNVRGLVLGDWAEATARILNPEESGRAERLLTKKYGWLKRMGDFFGKSVMRRKRALIAIRLTA